MHVLTFANSVVAGASRLQRRKVGSGGRRRRKMERTGKKETDG